jgi:hypothetical protein
MLWPLSPALAAQHAFQARLLSGLLTVVVCSVLALMPRPSSVQLTVLTVMSAFAGIALLVVHVNATGTCVTEYNGELRVIGRTLTPAAAEYAAKNPALSASDLLLDAAGDSARVWTSWSVELCRFSLAWSGVGAVPLFALAVSSTLAQPRFRLAAARVKAAHAHAIDAPTYDAFLSYRHTEPDQRHAEMLLQELEAKGYRVAIDFRDFRPHEHFLTEMERCIKQSRFILCVASANYVESDHCIEEAIISKTIDLSDRGRRLVPLIFERIELPIWLHGLVGIDFTEAARVEPMERLDGLLASARDSHAHKP